MNTCKACVNLSDVEDLSTPYVIRACDKCGRKIYLRPIGDHGHGIKVDKGDQFVIPENFIQIAANPLKGSGHLFKPGLAWFAQLIFVNDIKTESELTELLEKNENEFDQILRGSPLLTGLNLDIQEDADKAISILNENKDSAEWWAFMAITFNSIVKESVAEGNINKAVWAMRAAERFRSMHVFKTHLEEVVWMGHSARRIVEVIQKWHANKSNSLEEFWQQLFNSNPYVLTQIFSVPVVFIRDKAYVGGMNIDQKNAKFVDYLFVNDSSNDALLIEIKTPVTKLLGNKYRNIFKPSSELSGAVVQTLDYRRELAKNIKQITEGTDKSLDIFNPRCVIVIGNAAEELDSDLKKKSFELYRTALKDIEIITYDELFKKAETLATLFKLVWKKTN